jgi:hypothetical protein
MPRGSSYTPEQLDTFIERVQQYQTENPDATRAGLARYAGADISVLKRLEKQGKLELPKPITRQQQRKRGIDWAKTLGRLNDRRCR